VAAGLDPDVAAVLREVPDPFDRVVTEPQLLWVDRPRARSSAWYELFPRSEGGLQGARKRLPAIAEMGFDVVYLPPIHPVGTTARKGPGNTLHAGPDDPGSPWAIGSPDGGHTAVEPDLGTLADVADLVADAAANGLEVALDYALQCSPDHPWVRDHPEWFHRRPDGSIRYAENPPKKYQDIFPINFWPQQPGGGPDDAAQAALWSACKGILDHWIAHGVRIFRVDNPHTKPMAFWEWLIPAVQGEHPDVLFLAEAFTTPKVMAKLAEVGFTQSYTYFTWRHSHQELTDYLVELSQGPTADYLRPNFWPNTPDILGGVLRHGNRAAFQLRLVLAALLSPNWGLYSGYELCENEPASPENEEYAHSEKYQIKVRDWDDPASLAPFIAAVNAARRAHPAFSELRSIRFHASDNDALLVFSKTDARGGDPVLVVVNLDPDGTQAATLGLDLGAMGLPFDADLAVRDELSGQEFTWHGPNPWVRLDPSTQVAHVLAIAPA
jgi:starch synthase (maltosyl-transferring)